MAQIAGYTISKSTDLTMSVEEAIQTSKKSSSFLVHMLTMMDPQQIKSNEIAKDVYKECLTYKEYLSELLWTEVETDEIASTLEELNQTINKYEMIKDIADEEWEFVEASSCCV